MQLWVFSVSNVWVEIRHSVLRYLWSVGSSLLTLLLICVWQTKFIQHCWMLFKFKEISEVQNVHLKMLLEDGETQTHGCKTFKCSEMLLEDGEAGRWWNATSLVASTRHHRARLLKYYPRQPCVPSFVKSRMLRPLQTHFLLFQQIFFILVCIQAGNPRVPPRALTSGPKPCGDNNIIFSTQKKIVHISQTNYCNNYCKLGHGFSSWHCLKMLNFKWYLAAFNHYITSQLVFQPIITFKQCYDPRSYGLNFSKLLHREAWRIQDFNAAECNLG